MSTQERISNGMKKVMVILFEDLIKLLYRTDESKSFHTRLMMTGTGRQSVTKELPYTPPPGNIIQTQGSS